MKKNGMAFLVLPDCNIKNDSSGSFLEGPSAGNSNHPRGLFRGAPKGVK